MGAGQPQPGQPPFGSSPATGPTQNQGMMAAGMARLSLILRLAEETLPLLGSQSEPGQDLVKCIGIMAKHLQPGSVSPVAENNAMQSVMLKSQQMAPLMAAMRQKAMQQPPNVGAVPPPPPQSDDPSAQQQAA